MSKSDSLNEAVLYLYNQMLNDGILRGSQQQQIQYVIDVISMINDDKMDMIEDICDNIKVFGYKEEHLLPLYSVLLNSITKTEILLNVE